MSVDSRKLDAWRQLVERAREAHESEIEEATPLKPDLRAIGQLAKEIGQAWLEAVREETQPSLPPEADDKYWPWVPPGVKGEITPEEAGRAMEAAGKTVAANLDLQAAELLAGEAPTK